ncbi:MAG: DUF507 family protein [Bdellovibrionales bacterium]
MISENRANHLAHVIREALKKQKLVLDADELQLLQRVKLGVNEFIKIHNEVDGLARAQLTNQKKNIGEGSMEWEVLYGRFYEQELQRKGL